MKQFPLLIFLIILNTVALSKSKKLFIKWVLSNKLPSVEEVLELKRPITAATNANPESPCVWVKLWDNKAINEQMSNYGDDYIYKTSRRECNLLITTFNLTTYSQLDYYKPVIRRVDATVNEQQDLDDIVYALVYLRSFEIVKTVKSQHSIEYKCQVNITVADVSEYTATFEALINDVVIFETDEVPRSTVKSNNHRAKRQSVVKNLLDYTLSSDTYEIYKGSKSKNIFKCELKLKDNYEDAINEKMELFEDLGYQETNSDEQLSNEGDHKLLTPQSLPLFILSIVAILVTKL